MRNFNKIATQSTFIALTIALSYVVFYDIWFSLELFLTETFFSKVKSNIPVDISIFLFCFAFSFLYIKKCRYHFNYNWSKLIFLLCIGGIYLLHRTQILHGWIFYSFSICEYFKYLDILFLLCILEIVALVFFICNNCKKNRLAKVKLEPFIFDKPTNKNDLMFKEYAEFLCLKILSTPADKVAFSIGICGGWGTGKSSFISLMQEYLEKEHNNKCIVIYFKPWLCNSPIEIVLEFFNLLKHSLARYNSNLSSDISEYVDVLLSLSDNGLSTILQGVRGVKNKEGSASDKYDDVSDQIEKIKIPILIFIDDIDRLYSNEIVETLRIIRNTANFPNLTFISVYDRPYLIDTLEKSLVNPELYLQKIFNIEINLPAYENTIIVQLLRDRINDKLCNSLDEFKERKLFFFDEKILINIQSFNHLGIYFKSIRDVIRFANSFSLNLEAMLNYMGERKINPKAFFLLELLRFSCLKTYSELCSDPECYLEIKEGHYILNKEKKIDEEKASMILDDLFINNKSDMETFTSYESFFNYISFRLGKEYLSLIEFKSKMSFDNSVESVIDWHNRNIKNIEELMLSFPTLEIKKNQLSALLEYIEISSKKDTELNWSMCIKYKLEREYKSLIDSIFTSINNQSASTFYFVVMNEPRSLLVKSIILSGDISAAPTVSVDDANMLWNNIFTSFYSSINNSEITEDLLFIIDRMSEDQKRAIILPFIELKNLEKKWLKYSLQADSNSDFIISIWGSITDFENYLDKTKEKYKSDQEIIDIFEHYLFYRNRATGIN